MYKKRKVKDLSYEQRVKLLKEVIDSFSCVTVYATYGEYEEIDSTRVEDGIDENTVAIMTHICTG